MSKEYHDKIDYLKNIAKLHSEELKEIKDEYLKLQIGYLIDNQINTNSILPKFLQPLAILSTFRTVLSLPNFFSLQAISLSKFDNYYYFEKAGDEKSIKQSYFQSYQDNILTIEDLSDMDFDPQQLIAGASELSITLADGLSRYNYLKIVNDILVTKYNSSVDSILQNIESVSENIKEKIGRSPNFIIMPTSIAKKIEDQLATYFEFDTLPIGILKIGCLKNKLIVYITSYSEDKILIGYRGKHPVDAGLSCCIGSLFYSYNKLPNKKLKIAKLSNVSLIRPDYFGCININ